MKKEDPDYSALGFTIKELRKEKMMSQEEFAMFSGLHRTYVGGVERGERNPSFKSLYSMLSTLNVSWENFGKRLESEISKRKEK